jgi:hypothetical protein
MKSRCVLLLAFAPCLGCFSTWDVVPKDLSTLRGFEGKDRVPMMDSAGSVFLFDRDTKLTFEHDDGRRERGAEAHRFSAIQGVDSYTLWGADERSRPLSVDLTDVSHVQATNFSASKTVGLSVGVTLGVAAAAAAIVAILSVGSLGFGGFGGTIGYVGAGRLGVGEPRGAGIGPTAAREVSTLWRTR